MELTAARHTACIHCGTQLGYEQSDPGFYGGRCRSCQLGLRSHLTSEWERSGRMLLRYEPKREHQLFWAHNRRAGKAAGCICGSGSSFSAVSTDDLGNTDKQCSDCGVMRTFIGETEMFWVPCEPAEGLHQTPETVAR